MPPKKGKPGGDVRRKGRGRKTTDWLADHTGMPAKISGQTTSNPASDNSRTTQRLTLTASGGGGQVSGTFTLTLEGVETRDINFNTTAGDLEDILKKDIKRVKRVKATGGPLHQSPIQIEFLKTTFPSVPELDVDDNNLSNANVAQSNVLSQTKTKWNWSQPAKWSDANSGRAIMEVAAASMVLTADDEGLWQLAYKRTLFAFDHRWVYKLHAYSVDNELLLRLTVPAVGGVNIMLPGAVQADHVVAAEGTSEALSEVYSEIQKWVRVGVGEFWD